MSTDPRSPVLVWFRDDHRLSDNPALTAAATSGSQVLCFAIVTDGSDGIRPLGGAARWWLHGSLKALAESLERVGSQLILFQGQAQSVIERIARETGASAIFWNRRYGSAEIALDSSIKKHLADRGIQAHSFNGRLLHEPWEISNQAGKPFQIFTPYLRAVLARTVAIPLKAPKRIANGPWPASLLKSAIPLEQLGLEPSSPDWSSGIRKEW